MACAAILLIQMVQLAGVSKELTTVREEGKNMREQLAILMDTTEQDKLDALMLDALTTALVTDSDNVKFMSIHGNMGCRKNWRVLLDLSKPMQLQCVLTCNYRFAHSHCNKAG